MLRSDETKVLHALLEVNSGEFDVSALLSELEARFDQELKRSKT